MVGTNPRVATMNLLARQGKTPIAIDTKKVLCYWEQDKSYVIWNWYYHDSSNTVVLENGEYMPQDLYILEYAVQRFHEKCLEK